MKLPVCAAILLCGMTGAHTMGADPSLMQMHTELRERVLAGSDASGLAARWQGRNNDASFQTFRDSPPILKTAMQIQTQGIALWDGQHLDKAVQAYTRAFRMLSEARAYSEAAFCLYFIAEIRGQQNRFRESLHHSSRGLSVLAALPGPSPFLRGLLLHSQGNASWMEGHLDISIRSFGEAQAAWARLPFHTGTLTIWGNLALLYEELGLLGRADSCYQRALAGVADIEDVPEIAFQLFSNYTRFLRLQGKVDQARVFLEKARTLQRVSPMDFLLLQHEIAPTPQTRAELIAARPESIVQRVELEMLLAEDGSGTEAPTRFRRALLWCDQSDHRFLKRRVFRKMGSWLEATGRFREAVRLYTAALEETRVPGGDLIFPFSRISDPLLDGLVRSRIGLGQWKAARASLHSLTRRRRERAALGLRAGSPPISEPDGELERLARLAQQDELWEPPPRRRIQADPTVANRDDSTRIELWPDGTRIYVWVDGPRASSRLILETERPVADSIEETLSPLYRTKRVLLPRPDEDALTRLSAALVWPLLDHIRTQRLVLIPHKALQHLPFEMLPDEEGTLLLDRFVVSYLPPARHSAPAVRGQPIAILPPMGPEHPSVERERELLGALFPDTRVMTSLNELEGSRADWLHISSHFTVDDSAWWEAEFAGLRSRMGVWRFLQGDFRSQLLSLGACDVGNRFSWPTPFWMGVADVLMVHQSNSVVLNRWRLDEKTSDLYMDFYRGVGRGESLDRALTNAKRRFRRQTGDARGRHPFYWAGLTYVGPPGFVLYPRVQEPPFLPVVLASHLLFLLAVAAWRSSPRQRGSNMRR